MSKIVEWVFGGKCRNCETKEIWHCGNSENLSGGGFVDGMIERLKIGTSHYCEKCKASMVHDVIFYGDKEDYKHLFDNINKKK